MSWKMKVAMYQWTEHPDWTSDLIRVHFNEDGTEILISERHRASEIVEIELVDRPAEKSIADALTVIAKLKSDQITDHVNKMKALNDVEAKYLCLTHDQPVSVAAGEDLPF